MIKAILNKNLPSLLTKAFSSTQLRKFLFFFGAPGAGKGDELRKIVKDQAQGMDPALVENIKKIMNEGKLVTDQIVLQIVAEKLKEPESEKGVIFDGFPRTVSQLHNYEKLYPTHLVINIFLEWSVLLEKLMARRTCLNCGKAYNLCSINRDGYEMSPLLPKVEGKCDNCEGDLIQRSDDTEAVITKRMKEYEAKTLPLLEVYKERGVVVDFEPKKGVKDYKKFFEFVKPHIDKIE